VCGRAQAAVPQKSPRCPSEKGVVSCSVGLCCPEPLGDLLMPREIDTARQSPMMPDPHALFRPLPQRAGAEAPAGARDGDRGGGPDPPHWPAVQAAQAPRPPPDLLLLLLQVDLFYSVLFIFLPAPDLSSSSSSEDPSYGNGNGGRHTEAAPGPRSIFLYSRRTLDESQSLEGEDPRLALLPGVDEGAITVTPSPVPGFLQVLLASEAGSSPLGKWCMETAGWSGDLKMI
jgi:hypothetical protein